MPLSKTPYSTKYNNFLTHSFLYKSKSSFPCILLKLQGLDSYEQRTSKHTYILSAISLTLYLSKGSQINLLVHEILSPRCQFPLDCLTPSISPVRRIPTPRRIKNILGFQKYFYEPICTKQVSSLLDLNADGGLRSIISAPIMKSLSLASMITSCRPRIEKTRVNIMHST